MAIAEEEATRFIVKRGVETENLLGQISELVRQIGSYDIDTTNVMFNFRQYHEHRCRLRETLPPEMRTYGNTFYPIETLTDPNFATTQLNGSTPPAQETIPFAPVLELSPMFLEKSVQIFTVLQQLMGLVNLVNKSIQESLIEWRELQKEFFNNIVSASKRADLLRTIGDQADLFCSQLIDVQAVIGRQLQNYQDVFDQRGASVFTVDELRAVLAQNANGARLNHNEYLLPMLTVQEKARQEMYSLIYHSFLLKEQPPQILKTQTRFSGKLIFLLGSALQGKCRMDPVTASIINEDATRTIQVENPGSMWHYDHESHLSKPGELKENRQVLEFNQQERQYIAKFKRMQLSCIRRADNRNGTHQVTEEKFSLLFTTKMDLHLTSSTRIVLRAISLPLVVTVHGNQEANANACILWDNAFAGRGRIPFVIPKQVPLSQLLYTLKQAWQYRTSTTQQLTSQHMDFLRDKISKRYVNSEMNRDTVNVNNLTQAIPTIIDAKLEPAAYMKPNAENITDAQAAPPRPREVSGTSPLQNGYLTNGTVSPGGYSCTAN